MDYDEKIKKLVKHYKYVAKSSKANGNASCTVNELNTAIDKTAELILSVAQIISND